MLTKFYRQIKNIIIKNKIYHIQLLVRLWTTIPLKASISSSVVALPVRKSLLHSSPMSPPPSTFLLLLAALALSLTLAAASSSSSHLFPAGPEQQTHLHFFIHDKISSPNATAVKVGSTAHPLPSATGLNFASVFVVDDLITVGPDPASETLGRARGLYSVSSLAGSDLYFSVHAVFTAGTYKGSSLAVLARDPILQPVRELPIVGGTGYFRLSRGFAFMRTHSFDAQTGDAVLELDVHVLHR